MRLKTLHKVLLGIFGLVIVVVAMGVVGNMLDPEGARKHVAERATARAAELAEADKADAGKMDVKSDEHPHEQHRFHAMNKACNPRYDEGINEVQKSLAFNQCNSERREFANGRSIVGWAGKITSMETDQGADVVSLEVFAKVDGFKIGYTTMPNRISDGSARTLIRPGTPLFEKVSNLREGQIVAFDAEFIPDPERGVVELSLTEKGSLRSPVFAIRFTDIRPYDPKVGAAVAVGEASSGDNTQVPAEITRSQSAVGAGKQPLPEMVGLYYLHGKTLLREAGFSPDSKAGMPHTVDSDPAECGNAGCSAPWINDKGEHACVGIRVDETQEESRWEIVSAQSGVCD